MGWRVEMSQMPSRGSSIQASRANMSRRRWLVSQAQARPHSASAPKAAKSASAQRSLRKAPPQPLKVASIITSRRLLVKSVACPSGRSQLRACQANRGR